ncbi:hypothetical protein CLOM_g15306 [Closterium sp. NIES-68]|nr:hypothetical protein CLOM_g15306 [Closterium sp. NIES-68]
MNSRASLALLLLLTLSSGSWLALAASKSAGLSDGATCYYDKNYTPMKPFCKRDFGCLVTKVVRNSPHFKFKGVCASDVPLDQITKKFCMFRSVMFAPGTSGITATSMCPHCTCRLLKDGPSCLCPWASSASRTRWGGGRTACDAETPGRTSVKSQGWSTARTSAIASTLLRVPTSASVQGRGGVQSL